MFWGRKTQKRRLARRAPIRRGMWGATPTPDRQWPRETGTNSLSAFLEGRGKWGTRERDGPPKPKLPSGGEPTEEGGEALGERETPWGEKLAEPEPPAEELEQELEEEDEEDEDVDEDEEEEEEKETGPCSKKPDRLAPAISIPPGARPLPSIGL
jgi:hypothetical protein